jgi:hypothetical protein
MNLKYYFLLVFIDLEIFLVFLSIKFFRFLTKSIEIRFFVEQEDRIPSDLFLICLMDLWILVKITY